MQLTKLEIKGFKSFGDKITINFNDGVTAIVGPNGCGKSNVVDAIRWVLGEQSTRMLRSEKMENIIFNGTQNRKPANLAEVSLSFNNNKGVLPTEFTTVTITRKLFRNGDSEYRLNDVKCRLKDITDLFLDTGIGADTYSIIELKMIDEIINNKDNSRRNLFEEASGISKYKVRKKQTLAKLRDTEIDLARVEDLLFEISKNLKTLENQAKKAEKFFQLKEAYKIASVHLAYHRIGDFSGSLENLQQQEGTQQQQLTNTQEQILAIEKELQKLRDTILSEEKNLGVQQKATQEHVNKIRAYESEKKVKGEKLRNLTDQESRLNAELTADKLQVEHIDYTLKRLHEELFEEQQKFDTQQASLIKDKTTVDELRLQQLSAKGKLEANTKEITTHQQQIHALEKEIAVYTIQRDALDQESLRGDTDTEAKQLELTQFNSAVEDLEARVESQQHIYEHAIQVEEELQQNITLGEQQLQALRASLMQESRSLDAKQNEYNLTKSLVDNLEGFPDSIKFLKDNAGWKEAYPLFSDILSCEEAYRVAIENYLDSAMNHYVVDSKADAIQAINLLADAAKGRANFFVLEDLEAPVSAMVKPLDTAMISALSVVQVAPKYQSLCERLLQDVYLIEIDLENDLPIDQGVYLHKNGKFSKHKLGLSGGSVGIFEGKRIGRAQNLTVLAEDIEALTAKIEALQAEIGKQVASLDSLRRSSQKESLDEIRFILNRFQNELVSVKTKQEQYQAFIDNTQKRKADISDKMIAIAADLLAAEPTLAALKTALEKFDEEQFDLQDRFDELSEILAEQTTVYNQNNIAFHQQQNKVASIQKDLEYRESQKEDLGERIIKNTADYQAVQLAMKTTNETADTDDVDLVAMYEQKDTLEKGLQETEKEYFAARKYLNEQEETLTQLRRTKEQSEVLVNAIKEKRTSLQMDLNTLKERLSVEFKIDLADLLNTEPPENIESFDSLLPKCEKLKKQLNEYGTVNYMAKEAYDEIIERFNFITKEKTDLLQAKESLLATIKEIDDSAKDKFMTAFTMVRENFIRVFRSLFNEEDSCDLILTDPANPLESDIDIVARPKGKRPLSINQLSGGEKTLTATALLFSLYLSKPAPFCIFDEVDAPLDDTNIDKFNNIIREFSNLSQFIVVSHNKRTIASTDIIYGVTMVEQGVSRVVAVDLRDVA
ncbi:chromosome segregation protein SMC [Sphingobacteriaceae bacterium WQ 2009]|uniref:Chromosome partition protein Smc n=1 Tax=Rhinopithecimicrobium faecis TaxID=2820698 RepID=A0A8T4HF72_9SPHI|nr:chromosome segregation protein SMC [Sphingobacteriaceae bacterium WQ 2009]